MAELTPPVVRNAVERSRYELIVDEQIIGIADYRVDGDVVIFPHTEVVAPRRGQGYGALLVQGALDDVRSSGRSVVARCWFVDQFIDSNPDYADLRAA
jgi:predicted GNAT family acetyltransferase